MDKRKEIIERMGRCVVELRDILIDIRAENGEGTQFDFVSHPALADKTYNLTSTVSQIDHLVFQRDDEDEE